MVKRIVKLDPKSYALAYEAAAVYRPSKDEADALETALAAMDAVGAPKAEPSPNPDLILREADSEVSFELLESQRDVIVAAINAIQWPGFALAKRRRALDLLRNAERVEVGA